MSQEHPGTESTPVPPKAARCRWLLSKGMYINAGLTDEQRCSGDGTVWCGETQRSYGPDNQLCGVQECCNPARPCYEAG